MNLKAGIFSGAIVRFFFLPVNPGAAGVYRLVWPLGLWAVFTFRFVPKGRELPWLDWFGLVEYYENVFVTPVYWGCICAGFVLFALGWRPRLVGFGLCLLLLPLVPLHGRHVSRQIVLLSFFAFCFLRSNVALSLPIFAPRSSIVSPGPIWPIRIIQLQLSAIYGFNAIAKTHPGYLSGQVLEGMSKMLPNFLQDISGGYLHLGPIALPVGLAAVASVAVEYFMAIGIWIPRLRFVVAAVGFSFHMLIKLILNIGFYDWACIFLYLCFLLPLSKAPGRSNAAASGVT
jgi:hypothetical protein